MRSVPCPQGHNYDADVNTFCPHCGVRGLDVTVPQTQAMTGPRSGAAPTEDAKPKDSKAQYSGSRNTDMTVALQMITQKMDPVVGWLICVSGPNKGRDYRLHSDWNKIGRDPRMDVCIEGDETISRDKQCEIGFDPRDKSFTLARGDGRAMVYLNDTRLPDAKLLNAYDKIEIGQSRFLFVPFCNEHFDWQRDSQMQAPPKA